MAGDSTNGDSTSDSETTEPAAPDDRTGEAGPLGPTVKSSFLWGLVGGLAFLVLVQGYDLLAELSVGLGAKLLVALVVTLVAAGATHAARGRLSAR